MSIREKLISEIELENESLYKICSDLVKIPSETIPGNTIEIADYAANLFNGIEGADTKIYIVDKIIANVVVKLKSHNPGKRLVFNGHLDTFPVGDLSQWDQTPFSGLIKDGRLYGRGASDMKCAISSYYHTMKVLSKYRHEWSGELVVTLAGDEETMGDRGTKYLLENVEDAHGDAMINGDIGSPNTLRFGQKGFIWIELRATGKPSHGAHVHKGSNAIDKLMRAAMAINDALPKLPVKTPKDVKKAILESSEVSEKSSGVGETQVLQEVTVNFGEISGGISPNLIPASATAKADIRVPVGITTQAVIDKIEEILSDNEDVHLNVFRRIEPNYSDPSHEIFDLTRRNCEDVLGEKTVVTMRVGASDSRCYRLVGNIPTINCGITPYNLGGPNEYIELEEYSKVAKIHLLTAFDYLNS